MRMGVYLAVPAYPVRSEHERAQALAGATAFARRLALPLTVSPLLDEIRPNGAWTAVERRRADLERALDHGILLAARGGYGCIDLIETLQRCGRRTAPLLVGYSDLTVLHGWWRRQAWGESVYGFLPAANAGPRALATAATCASGDAFAYDGEADEATAVRPGEAEGVLFAGCLRVLAGLTGTPAMPDLRGTILALEDIDERPYQVDRDLRQLHLAGALAGVRGLVFGRFPCERRPDDRGPTMAELMADWARRLAVPTLGGLAFGHDADPYALPCGRRVVLRCDHDRWRLDCFDRVAS